MDFTPVSLQLLEATKGDNWPSTVATLIEIVWEIIFLWMNKQQSSFLERKIWTV